jgi:hypothetical protein
MQSLRWSNGRPSRSLIGIVVVANLLIFALGCSANRLRPTAIPHCETRIEQTDYDAIDAQLSIMVLAGIFDEILEYFIHLESFCETVNELRGEVADEPDGESAHREGVHIAVPP